MELKHVLEQSLDAVLFEARNDNVDLDKLLDRIMPGILGHGKSYRQTDDKEAQTQILNEIKKSISRVKDMADQ